VSEHRKLYNLAAWKRARAAQLREHPLCRMHMDLGQTVEATVVDHITPHKGDMVRFLDGENLQSLCKPCHDGHKQAQERNPDGLLRGAGLDGRPLDLAHPWHSAGRVGGDEKSKANSLKTAHEPLFAKCQNGRGGL
jgi:hypothetical protein